MDSTSTAVHDNRDEEQFELRVDDAVAFLAYEREADRIVFIHTEVPEALRGRGIGETLVKGALALARSEGRRVVPVCPYVKAYLRKHPDES